MSVSTPKLSVVRLIAAKAETTTGTEMTVTASDATFIMYDPKIERDANTNERQLMAGKGQSQSVPGLVSGTFTARTELASSGAAGTSPAWALVFLPACDMVETSGSWAFTSGGVTLTIALYEDGCKRILYGARGSFKITKESGKPGMVEWTFKGKYKEDADTSILVPTFPTTLPDCVHDTLTVGAVSPIFTKVEVDAGNDVQIRENANATDGTGIIGAAIVNKKPAGSVDPEQVSLATWDMNALVDAATEQAFSLAVGATAGNIVTVASSHCQLKSTQRGDRNGIITRDVGLQFNTAAAFTVVFS